MHARFFSPRDWERVAVQAGFQPREMAAISQISLRQLERLFAKAFQLTPKAWLRRLRCRLALGLITEGHSNKEVVAELRFGSPSHFCHDFRKEYPESPRRAAVCLIRAKMSQTGNKCPF